MKGLVHIRLRHRDIIFKPSRDRLIHLMDNAERRIAVHHRIHDDAHRKQVIDLINGLILVFHLFINAEKMLDTAVYLCFDSGARDMLSYLVHNRLDILLPNALADRNRVNQLIIGFRFQIF